MADSTRAMRRSIFERELLPVWKNRLLTEITPDVMNVSESVAAEASSLPPVRDAQDVRMATEHQKYSTENQAEIIAQYPTRRGFEIVKTRTRAKAAFGWMVGCRFSSSSPTCEAGRPI